MSTTLHVAVAMECERNYIQSIMDTVAHTLGGLAARDMAPGKLFKSRAFLWVALVVANMPDLDLILMPFSNELYFRYHRGITHSLLLLPIWAILGALAVHFISKRKVKIAPAFGWYSLVVVVHLFLDWITSYGTELFAPLSHNIYSAHLFPIFDLWTIVILGSTIFAGRFFVRSRKRVTAVVLIVFTCYTGFRVYSKYTSEKLLRANIENVDRIISYADISSPALWVNPSRYRVAVVSGDSVASFKARPLAGSYSIEATFDIFDSGDKYWDEVNSFGMSGDFLSRSDLPVIAIKDDKLYLSDLRYGAKIGNFGTISFQFQLEADSIVSPPKLTETMSEEGGFFR